MFSRYSNDEHQAMLHVINNPAQYGPETVKEMIAKALSELDRLWHFERTAKYQAEEILQYAKLISGKEQA